MDHDADCDCRLDVGSGDDICFNSELLSDEDDEDEDEDERELAEQVTRRTHFSSLQNILIWLFSGIQEECELELTLQKSLENK
jgi:hypothetical protein